MKIVFTPIHGSGVKLVPEVLRKFGFRKIYTIPEQDVIDGDFPTVKQPNPEEPAALSFAIKEAKKINAELVLATDPDADRVGTAINIGNNKFILLNGNQFGALLIYYLLKKWKEKNKLTGKEYIVKTIVTSELLKDIADKYKVECFDVLTGFKYIADIIKNNEGKKTFIGGGEESYGFLAGEFVRDKDAVISCALFSEIAAWAKENCKNIHQLLLDIYCEFGFYKEKLKSLVKKGKEGEEEIKQIMSNYRNNPPVIINNSKIILIKDYLIKKEIDRVNNVQKNINLPESNVLQFFLDDGSKISMRPSGTEPKIKFYISVRDKLKNKYDYDNINNKLDKKIENIIKSFKI